ncbi:MAG: choice-of-anchor Q domain-containing protein [Kiritimatiellae bacterium]|nr:choice-of-anchor Q domain-containing protein [Kiritimatiellia bacterium]
MTDPRFKNFDAGDYRLAAGSPCVNAGDNRDWMTNAVDLDGRTRIRYGRVDMGAYERIHAGTCYGVR